MCEKDEIKYFFIREKRTQTPRDKKGKEITGFHKVGIVGVKKVRKNGTRYLITATLCSKDDNFVTKKGVAMLEGRFKQNTRVSEFDMKDKPCETATVNIEHVFELLNLQPSKYNIDWSKYNGKIEQMVDLLNK